MGIRALNFIRFELFVYYYETIRQLPSSINSSEFPKLLANSYSSDLCEVRFFPNVVNMKNSAVFIGLLCICIRYTVLGYSAEEEEDYDYSDQMNEENSYENIEMRSRLGPNCQQNSPCNPEVVSYLNKKISTILEEYPKKSPIDITLDAVFNAEREKLAKAYITTVNQLSNCKKADIEMKKFHEFVNKYQDLRMKIWAALAQLNKINEEPQYAPTIKNEALKIKIALKEVDSLSVAENLLQQYEKFLKMVEFDSDNLIQMILNKL